MWEPCLVGQTVERRAQAANHRGFFFDRRLVARSDRDGIVAAHHRSEVAACGELVMQATIRDEKNLTMARFTIDYPREIYARFTDQIPPQFDAEARILQR